MKEQNFLNKTKEKLNKVVKRSVLAAEIAGATIIASLEGNKVFSQTQQDKISQEKTINFDGKPTIHSFNQYASPEDIESSRADIKINLDSTGQQEKKEPIHIYLFRGETSFNPKGKISSLESHNIIPYSSDIPIDSYENGQTAGSIGRKFRVTIGGKEINWKSNGVNIMLTIYDDSLLEDIKKNIPYPFIVVGNTENYHWNDQVNDSDRIVKIKNVYFLVPDKNAPIYLGDWIDLKAFDALNQLLLILNKRIEVKQ